MTRIYFFKSNGLTKKDQVKMTKVGTNMLSDTAKRRQKDGNETATSDKVIIRTSLGHFLRYVAMIFAVLVMSMANIGMAWGAYDVPANGKVTLSTKVNNDGRFNVEASGVYHFRKKDGYSWSSGDGIKTQSNLSGVIFYLDASTEIEVGIKHTESKNAHDVTVHVYSIPESEYKQFDDNKAGAAESDRTFSTGPSTSSDDSFTISVAAETKTFTGTKTLAAGYYAVVPVGEKSKTFFTSIKFTSGGVTKPTFSPATGSSLVKSTGTVTLTSSGNTVYYKWSQTDNQYASGAGATLAGAADGSGPSPVNATAPSTAGTWYLYAVAKNGSDYSDVVKATYTITNPTYTVSYNLNGGKYNGSDDAPTQAAVESGTNITMPVLAPTKADYAFVGWRCSVNSADYMPSASYTMTAANTTFTAQWATACFEVPDARKNSNPAATITASMLKGNKIAGGTLTWESASDYSGNGDHGLILNEDGEQIVVTLSEGTFVAGSIITITTHGNSGTSKTCGVKVSGNNMTPATYSTSTAYLPFTQTYVVKAGDGIVGTNTFAIKRYNSNQVYIYSITVSGCGAPSCTAPSSVGITGTNKYLAGQDINLTATPTGHTGTPTYQWQKEINSVWTNVENGGNISGATTNNLQITGCDHYNSGQYRCVVSTGSESCTTNSDAFGVHVFTVYGGYVGDTWSDSEIQFSAGTSGTATVHLNAGSLYKFHVRSNNGAYYCNGEADYNGDGNADGGSTDGWYTLGSFSNWSFGRSSRNFRIYTGAEGDYTITVDIANALVSGDYVTVSVTYPTPTHPSEGYAYFEKPNDWNGVKLYWYTDNNSRLTSWDGSPEITATTTICGTTYYYTPLGTTFSNVIFRDKGSNQWTSLATSGFSGKYLDKTTYASPAWASFSTYTITYAANGGGGSMSATSGICPDADQAITSNSFTAPTGCASFAHWTANVAVKVGGATVAAGNPIANGATIEDINSDITLTAVWKLATPTITDNGDNTFSISGSIGGATYYYTTNNSTPTTSSSSYSSAVDFSAGETNITAKAIAHKDGYVDSDVASQACTYHAPAVACYEFDIATSGSAPSVGDAVLGTGDAGMTVAGLNSSGSMTYNSYGIKFNGSGDKLQVVLPNNMKEGTVISIKQYSTGNGSNRGITLKNSSDANVTDIIWNPSGSAEENTITYTVTSSDGLKNTNTFYLVRKTNSYLKNVTVSNCGDAACTTPTTAFANGAYTVGGSALDLSTLISSSQGGGAITYTVKNANGTGATIAGTSFTATSAGTATVTATQAADGGYCEKVMDAAITVSAAPAGQTALVINTLYEVPDMIPSGASLTSSDQFFDGLSANTKFELIGSGSGSTTPKVNNNSDNDKTIDGITFDDGSMWFKGNASLTSNIPTTYGLSFIVPEGGGKLYLYFSGTSTNIKLAKSGSSGSKPSCPNGYGEVDVTAGTYYLYGTGTTAPYCFYGLKLCSKYSVSITTTNVTKATGDATAVHGKAYTATFTANTGYTLPSDVTVSIGGVAQTKGTGYTWTVSSGTGTLTVPAAYVTGNIVVSVAGVAAVTHDVTFSLTNVAYSSGDNQGTGAATEGSAFSTVFAASSGYSLPGTITVTIGGVEQTVGTGYTWVQGSGTLTIPAAYVTDDIVVTIVGEEMEGDGCDELVHTEAATATTLTTTVGSATLTSPSGQTANDKAIKLNSSGYIELSPKAGKSFAAGDSLIIVMWNQASSAKTTGYRIAGTDYTASMPSKVNTTFRRKLIAADIVSSKVKIERESDNGSNAYFVSAIIKHCEDLPSCTTPTLPTLSNQIVCPGSDIAAWNAEPTNIATITGASEDVAYSWKKKGSDTELAATASFDLGSSATEGMAGTYVVTVTVSKTGYISKSASAEVDLTVTPATETPSVTASKAKVYATDEVTLTATCGSTGVTWNWYLCANADGTGAGSSLGTSATYTIASAPAAGTYYYKAVATGDGTHSCGTAEYVYTLVVSAANSCDKEFWFAKEADRPTGAAAATHITGCPSGSSSASYTASIDGTNYTLTGSTGQKTGNVTIVVPADNTGTLYVVVQGSSSRTITLSKGGTQIGQETPANSTWGVFTFDNLDAGTYTLVSSGNISWGIIALKLCPTVACTDDTPTAAATNATVCVGGSITITATGYEAGATFQWQKQNATTSVWENIDGATSDTYTVAPAAAEHAGNYHIVATKNCARTSNTVTIAVPSAPVFNSFTTTRRVMETQALSISDVSATDAVSYTWYKSADATWDAGDTEIGTSKNLLKPYDGETAGSTYYVFCRATNSCGATTSSAITVTVQTLVEEDCAIVGNSGEHNTFAKTGNVSSGTYGSIAELHTNSNNKYIYYTAESGYYFATATVNACVGNASDLPTAAYSYSTDGGANWTDQNLTGMTTAYADHVINLPANVNAFRVGRRLGDCGISSSTIYIHQVCFTYNENCTKTTVDPSSASVTHEIGDSFTEPTFTVKSSGVALSPQPTITYTSSDETVATVDDDGTVNFQDKAGTVVITAAYAGDATYCESEGSYTITVSCSDEAPRIIAAEGTNLGGCNDNITLEAKKQDGTTNFSDGTYQWYRDGEAISGATSRTYTVSLTGVYSVEHISVGGCVSPSSNKATVTSESAEPEVERLTPFQYYHVDKVYAETSIMRFRHLFAVKNAGTTLEGKHFKMELSRNGGSPTDVTTSNAFVMSADTVLLDMNKLYNKYALNDELVLTCSAVDCEGNVSSIYKNTITIYVIDETPTLALICSGADGDGTRDTKKLVVGGDFLTGYNKADLCVQTGKTSFDKTQEWVLYTRLKENYIVTPVNGYAEFNKLNYEPFDILFLTDYPKASKSDAAATILDDMADLCDYRPLFTFKTHMVHKSPSKWAAKGFMAQPEVPKQSRLRLNIVCYAHPMFDDLKEVSDQIQKDASDHSQIVYTMLTGPGHESSKGMQGFPIDAAEGFVTIGLVHYDATAADDTPSEGYVTWTPESDDVMLVAAAERQVNLEARMILFSINCGAQSKLTETGRQVVLRSLEYLLSDATITPVADCSFTFTNGAGNDWTYEQYKAKCPACTGTIGDGKWSTAGNWGPDWILQPGKDTEVKIAAPVTVDMPHAKVRTVRILEGGSIDIPAGSGLEVGSTIRRLDGTEISPTEENDIHIGSASTGNGTLIFNNNFGDTKARVDMYSNAKADVANMSATTSTWQYIGTPHTDVASATRNYYDSWLYQYSGSGWEVIPNGGPLVPFRGYCVTHPAAPVVFDMVGTLVATTTQDIAIPAGYTVIANSWVAPIDINAITDDDMEGISDKSIYFFNTGTDADGTAGTGTEAGTYRTTPIHSASYTGDWQIPSMQGFYISTESDGTLHLDYDRHVRPTGSRSVVSNPMYAPRRAAAESDEPNVLKIFARGSRYQDKLVVLEREDFTRGYDSGWDGEAWGGGTLSPMVYVTGEGREDAVSAIPEFEGTVIAFKAGEDSEYRFEFVYSEDAEPLYLFDTENNTYTQIMTGNAYYFTTSDKSPHSRFILTRKNPQVATGVEPTSDSSLKGRAKKLLIEDKMFIMVNGMLYDATGKVVK